VSDPVEGHRSDAAHADAEHATPHLPSNSWTPLTLALSLAVIFVGFLGQVRDTIGPTMWLVGLIGLIVSIAVWVRGSIHEYRSLPEEGGH